MSRRRLLPPMPRPVFLTPGLFTVVLFILVLLLAGCSGSSREPSAASPPAPAATKSPTATTPIPLATGATQRVVLVQSRAAAPP